MKITEYIQSKVRAGWGLLAVGAVLIVLGLILQFVVVAPFNARIVSGLGIFLAGLGLAQLLRYRAVKGNHQAAARLVNEERDERLRLIRAQAGSRGFWVSLGLTYALLMWLSFASNGSLPAPSQDTLWYALAAAVVVPFIVYIASFVYDQNHS